MASVNNLQRHGSGDAPTLSLTRHDFRRGARHPTSLATAPTSEEIARRLKRFALFADLPDTALANLAARAEARAFRAWETLWHRHDSADLVLFIETGLAKTARHNSLGQSRTYGLHGPGDSLGIYALWAGRLYPTDAVALSEGMTALAVQADGLLDLARRNRRFAERIAVEIGRFTEAFIDKIEIVSAGPVARRIAALLAMLLERFGGSRPGDPTGDTARLPITLPLELIGEIVDARIETVARTLSLWKRQGWLAVDDAGYDIKRLDALRALIASPS